MSYYGSSGDVRVTLNGGLPSTHPNYMGEEQASGEALEMGRKYAYDLINGKLEPSYPDVIPWTSGAEPQLISTIANLLAVYYVLSVKTMGENIIDKVKKAFLYDDPVEMLDQMASFQMQLPEEKDPLGEAVFHTHEDRTPIADVDAFENQHVDPDRLDDIDDERKS